MDRRQVDDVEAELRERRQLLLDAPEAAPRAREELVPRPERGALAIDVDLERVRPRLLVPVPRRRRQRFLRSQRVAPEELIGLG
jgi:hypothetical protein